MAITSRALLFATRWFDEATVRRTFEPLIADWQREWQDASRLRRWSVSARGLGAFLIAALVSSPAIVKTAPPPVVVRRVIARVACFITVVAIVLAIPLLMDQRPRWQAVPLLLLAAIPSGAVLAFPFSMLLAVDVIRRERDIAPNVARATAVKLAFAAVVFMAIGHGFVVPAANQQFRRSINAGRPEPKPGLRERTTIELFADAAREQPAERDTRAGAIRSELTSRSVLGLMPAIFIWLRWIAHDVRRPRRFWPLPVAAMTIVAAIGFFASYWSGFLAESTWHLRPGNGLWLPIVIATLIGVTQQWLNSRRDAAA